jgi:hypothetical protein
LSLPIDPAGLGSVAALVVEPSARPNVAAPRGAHPAGGNRREIVPARVPGEWPSGSYADGRDLTEAIMQPAPLKTVSADQTLPADLLADFEAAARRPLRQRMRYAFIHTYKPVLDDAPFRAFATTADYRQWCEENLPDWLGYGRIRLPSG